MNLPPLPLAGQPVSGEYFRQLHNYLESIRVVGGPDLTAQRTSYGTTLVPTGLRTLGGAGGSSAQATHPFKLADGSVTTPTPTAAVSVVYGTVNSVVPTIDDAVTAVQTPLDGTTDTPARPPILATPSDGGVWLKVTWTGAEPNRTVDFAEVVFDSGFPSDTLDVCYYRLGDVNAASGAVSSIAQAVTHSLFVQRVFCNGFASYFWNAV